MLKLSRKVIAENPEDAYDRDDPPPDKVLAVLGAVGDRVHGGPRR